MTNMTNFSQKNYIADDEAEPTRQELDLIEQDKDLLKEQNQEGKDKQAGSDNQIHTYLQKIAQYPLLNAKEEVALAKRIESGDKEAEELLTLSNLRLVCSIAKRYNHCNSMSFMDLVQEGTIGLMTAVKRFDYRKGYKFSTYAVWWIRQAIMRAITNENRMIRIPVHYEEKIFKIQKKKKELALEHGCDPTNEEIANALDMTPEAVREALMYSETTISLDTPVSTEQDDGNSTLVDFMVSNRSDHYDDPELKAEKDIMKQSVWDLCYQTLTDRERSIVFKRYGIGGGSPMTLEEIGKEEGVTRERIRQLEAKAMRKLRNPSVSNALKDFVEAAR